MSATIRVNTVELAIGAFDAGDFKGCRELMELAAKHPSFPLPERDAVDRMLESICGGLTTHGEATL